VFEVDVHRLSVEPSQNCSGDRLQLFDEDTEMSDPLCGNKPPSETFYTRSSTLLVRFQSDQSGSDAGFVLGYAVVEGEQQDLADVSDMSGQRTGLESGRSSLFHLAAGNSDAGGYIFHL